MNPATAVGMNDPFLMQMFGGETTYKQLPEVELPCELEYGMNPDEAPYSLEAWRRMDRPIMRAKSSRRVDNFVVRVHAHYVVAFIKIKNDQNKEEWVTPQPFVLGRRLENYTLEQRIEGNHQRIYYRLDEIAKERLCQLIQKGTVSVLNQFPSTYSLK